MCHHLALTQRVFLVKLGAIIRVKNYQFPKLVSEAKHDTKKWSKDCEPN